jgi:NAD(P)H-hydrate epimerase
LRAGAGLVTVGIPGSLNNILEAKLTEAMTEPLPETAEGSLSLNARDRILELLEGKTALAIGPGLSTNPETSALVRQIIGECGLPMVIDADGLNALAGEVSVFESLDDKKILTPHPGEMGRLVGLTSAEVQLDRVGVAADFTEKHGCYLALKGARTLVAEPGGMIYLNPTGNPSLSSGGSGDVLTGLIAGLLARGWPVSKAAIAGIYIHGLAADLLAEDMGKAGLLAGELLDVVPGLMNALVKKIWPLKGVSPFIDFYQPL